MKIIVYEFLPYLLIFVQWKTDKLSDSCFCRSFNPSATTENGRLYFLSKSFPRGWLLAKESANKAVSQRELFLLVFLLSIHFWQWSDWTEIYSCIKSISDTDFLIWEGVGVRKVSRSTPPQFIFTRANERLPSMFSRDLSFSKKCLLAKH